MTTAALPAADLLDQQARWLAPARSRCLRGVAIAHRCRVLDLGSGYGAVTGELVRRSGGLVAALDTSLVALGASPAFEGASRIAGHALQLPFADAALDLVFCQITLLWVPSLRQVLREIARVLAPQGALVALEPDYGGMLEYPPGIATRDLWITALQRAGADPYVGRKLPAYLDELGFDVRVELLNVLHPPHPARFAFLRDLLEGPELEALRAVEMEAERLSGSWSQVAHLPFFLVTARKLPI